MERRVGMPTFMTARLPLSDTTLSGRGAAARHRVAGPCSGPHPWGQKACARPLLVSSQEEIDAGDGARPVVR